MRNEGLRQAAPIESATPLFGIAHISTALIDTMLTKITRRSRSYQAASSPRPRRTHVLGIIKLESCLAITGVKSTSEFRVYPATCQSSLAH